MTDDYKHISSPSASRTKPTASWLLGLVCLVLGSLATAAWLHWQPALPTHSTLNKKEVHAAPPPSAIINTDAAPAQIVQPTRPTQPDFEFYTILPKMEVPIPKWDPAGNPSEPKPTTAVEATPSKKQTSTKGSYYLQAGSFQSLPEAEVLRKRIEKIGLPVEVQTVRLLRQGEWHRVRSGPFSNLPVVDKAREQLLKSGIHFILLKQIDATNTP